MFFIFGVWVYKIVRPHEKIGEVWERNLAEEALLAEVEAIHHCPTCERRIDDEWIICPTCRTRLNRVCPNCSRLVGLDWSLCAWCGKDFERREVPVAAISGGRDATSRISRSSRPPHCRLPLVVALAPLEPVRVRGSSPVRAGRAARALSSSGPTPPPGRIAAPERPARTPHARVTSSRRRIR